MNQLGTPVSIWNGSAFLFAWPSWEFRLWSRLWSGSESDAELFMYPTYCINYFTYFESSLTEMSIFRLLNLLHLKLRSASESNQQV